MITIENLTVKYGGVVALDSLTLNISDDVVGLIGPNGAGKTTLFNVIAGVLKPTSGRVTMDGVVRVEGAARVSGFELSDVGGQDVVPRRVQ